MSEDCIKAFAKTFDGNAAFSAPAGRGKGASVTIIFDALFEINEINIRPKTNNSNNIKKLRIYFDEGVKQEFNLLKVETPQQVNLKVTKSKTIKFEFVTLYQPDAATTLAA